MVQPVTRDYAVIGDCQRNITRFHEELDIRLVKGNHYEVDLDGLNDFVNDDNMNPFEGKEEPYTRTDNLLDFDKYANNAVGAESEADFYNT